MKRDVEIIIERSSGLYPDLKVKQLKVTHPSDDDGIWFFHHPNASFEVQLESTFGACPFLIETNENEEQLYARSLEEAIDTLIRLLRLQI